MDVARYVWTPGLNPLLGGCGVALAGVCLAFAVRSVVWWKTTGPVSESERSWFHGLTGGPKLLLAAVTVAGLLYPFGLAVGVVLLLFQVSPSTTVLLVSRENRTSALSVEWQVATTDSGRTARTIDAGCVVDRALQLFSDRHTGTAAATDASTIQTARQAAIDAVREAAANDFASARVPKADAVSFGSAAVRVQSWVVESIEMAVMRLLAEHVNVGLSVVLTGGRRDAAGMPTWQHANDYLRPTARFIGRPDVHVVDGAPSGRLRLVGADEMRTMADGSREILLTFHSPATPGGGTESVQISPGSTRLAIRRSARNDIVRMPITLPPATERVKAENARTGGTDVVPVSSFADGWTTKTVRVLGPANWQRTVEQINTPRPATPTDQTAGWWLRLAHNRLFVGGLLPVGTVLTFGGDPVPGDLVIDGKVNGGVLMYCATSDPPPTLSTLRPLVTPPGLLTVWTPRDGVDQVFGLGNLELPPAALATAAQPSQVVEAFATDIRSLQLRHGRPSRRPRDDHPLLAIMPDPRQPHTRGIVWLGVSPEELHLTAPENGSWDNEMRAAAFWTGMIDAVQYCPHPVMAGPSQPDDGQRPVVLLSAADIQQEASARYAAGSVVLAASFAAAAIWSLFQFFVRRK